MRKFVVGGGGGGGGCGKTRYMGGEVWQRHGFFLLNSRENAGAPMYGEVATLRDALFSRRTATKEWKHISSLCSVDECSEWTRGESTQQDGPNLLSRVLCGTREKLCIENNTEMYLPPVTSLLLVLFPSVCLSLSTPFVVQSLSSRAALVMGGYGPGYAEMKGAEVITHEGVCQGAIRYEYIKKTFLNSFLTHLHTVSDVPSSPSGRYLGAESGLAETVGSEGDEVLFCRRRRCWRLNVKEDAWREVSDWHKEIMDRRQMYWTGVQNGRHALWRCLSTSFAWTVCLRHKPTFYSTSLKYSIAVLLLSYRGKKGKVNQSSSTDRGLFLSGILSGLPVFTSHVFDMIHYTYNVLLMCCCSWGESVVLGFLLSCTVILHLDNSYAYCLVQNGKVIEAHIATIVGTVTVLSYHRRCYNRKAACIATVGIISV